MAGESEGGATSPWRELALSNIAALASLAIVVVGVLRVALVARGDVPTAQAIIRYTGPANILIGVLPSVLPSAAFYLTTELFEAAIFRPKERLRWGLWCVIAFTTALIFSPVAFVLIAVLFMVGLLVQVKHNPGQRDYRPNEAWAKWGLALALSISTGIWSWLPLETVETKDGPVVGYVLRDGGGDLAVLKDEPRRIEIIDPEAVESRYLCGNSTDHWFWRALLAKSPGYPDCPE